jgi:hypothetical protein
LHKEQGASPSDGKTATAGQNRRILRQINFLEHVPELPISSRPNNERSINLGDREAQGELRLRVLASLPPLHQRYLFEEIRKRCSRFLRQRGVTESEVSVEELLSEVWAKLLGSLSIQDERTMSSHVETTDDPHAPDRDGRVIWLIEEIGGVDAISHRLEDIFRQRYGRHKPDVGRRLVQANGHDDSINNDGVAEPLIEIEDDIPLIWIGLVHLAKTRFPPEDDVSMLLQLFKDRPGLFDDAPNAQWPINEMVTLLNRLFPDPPWRIDRVDNAKRRLVNWIRRLKQRNGLDQTDLEALFVRIARRLNIEGREVGDNKSNHPFLS